MTEHRIVAVQFVRGYGPCDRDGPDTPHNVIAYCACGKNAVGKTDHIWKVTARAGDRVTLTPSFNWLNDPADAAKGSHVHESVALVTLWTDHDRRVSSPAT